MAQTTIFYFTGTGNSLKVARDLAAKLGGAELVRISKKNLQGTGTVDTETVAIVFPVYYGGLPHMVTQFAGNLLVADHTYVFAVATFGGAFRDFRLISSQISSQSRVFPLPPCSVFRCQATTRCSIHRCQKRIRRSDSGQKRI